MGFNYGLERKRVEKEFEKFRCACQAAGMNEEDIEVMYQFDRKQLNSDRRFYRHIQPMEDRYFSDGGFAGEGKSPLLQRNLAALSVDMGEMSMDDRHDWVEDLTDARLVQIKQTLSPEEIEFLSHLVVDRLSPAELSRKLGISRAAVSKRLKRIKNKLEKITAQG